MHVRHSDILAAQEVENVSEAHIENKVWREDVIEAQAERRIFERFPAKLDARLFFGNMIYAGRITDLSQSGMFINTKVGFPVNSEFFMVVLVDGRTLKIPVRVKRRVKTDKAYSPINESGIGVELMNSSQKYMEFIENFKSVI